MSSAFKNLLWACWDQVAQVAARSYIVGPELKDALLARHQSAAAGMGSTLCYWNTEQETPQQVAAVYGSALDALAGEPDDDYIAIKSTALGFHREYVTQVLERARQFSKRLHFGAHGPEVANATFALIEQGLPRYANISCTLPGRWRRSIADADWAVQRALTVQVVKGQWPDTVNPEVDLREGFLAVIDRLAGRARHVAVATHDAPLAREALRRLQTKNTSCELELLYGLPLDPPRKVAQAAGVGVRLYLPYGHGYLPYVISQVYKNPRIIGWVLRDFCGRRSLSNRNLERQI